MSNKRVTQDRLKELLRYNRKTGVFTWKSSRGSRAPAGSVAGSKHQVGYISICIDGICYPAHRLAWLYVYGPTNKLVIAKNGDLQDTRLRNLICCSRYELRQKNRAARPNNISGVLGVTSKPNGSYQALIYFNGQRMYLGSFRTKEAAGIAYRQAKERLHWSPHLGDKH